jgi:hypothetical protein
MSVLLFAVVVNLYVQLFTGAAFLQRMTARTWLGEVTCAHYMCVMCLLC